LKNFDIEWIFVDDDDNEVDFTKETFEDDFRELLLKKLSVFL